MHARIGHAQLVLGIGVAAARAVDLVFGIEQVQQAALADFELLAVGVARALDGHHIALEEAQLLVELDAVVVGDGGRLSHVAAAAVAQVGRLRHEVGELAAARPVGAAVKEVPGHQQFDRAVAAPVGHAAEVAAFRGARAGLEARLEHAALAFGLRTQRTQVLDGRAHAGVALGGFALCLACRRGQALAQASAQQSLRRRRLAHHAVVARGDVVQVGHVGEKVRLGQRQAGAALLDVDAAADARLEAAADLVERDLVLHVVVFGELHEAAKAQHVVVGARGLERGLLGGVCELEIAHAAQVVEARHLVACSQAVPEQLRHGEADASLREAPVGGREALGGLAGAPDVGVRVQARVISAAGDVDLVASGTKGVEARRDVGVGQNGFLRRIPERVRRLRRRADGTDDERATEIFFHDRQSFQPASVERRGL